MKYCWVVYKVIPEIGTCRYDAYVERHDDDDVIHVYQEKNKGHQSICFTVSDGVGLTELATHDVELMEEESSPSNKRLQKSK
jgi:RNA recognition motif-containing protein